MYNQHGQDDPVDCKSIDNIKSRVYKNMSIRLESQNNILIEKKTVVLTGLPF